MGSKDYGQFNLINSALSISDYDQTKLSSYLWLISSNSFTHQHLDETRPYVKGQIGSTNIMHKFVRQTA